MSLQNLDQFPTPAFREVDERISEKHAAFLELSQDANSSRMLEDLRRTAADWEGQRGFTTHERSMIVRQLRQAKRKGLWTDLASVLSIVFLTYFASITLNEALGGGYLYPFGSVSLRIAPLPWLMWCVLILGVEKWALVPNLDKLLLIRQKRQVLSTGFDRSSRVKGYRYVFLTNEEAKAARKLPLASISAGIFLLGIELACNVLYLFKFSDVEGVLGYLIAFLPLAFFLVLMFPLTESRESVRRLEEALLTPERPSQTGRDPVSLKTREFSATSKLAHDEWEALGPRDPDKRT